MLRSNDRTHGSHDTAEPADPFVITLEQADDGVCRLRLFGALANGAAPSLRAVARQQLAASPRLLALDLTHLARLTSAGAQTLATIAEWAGDAHIALCLIVPPGHPVRDALVAADLRERFAIHPDFERNDLKPNRPPPGASPVGLPVVDLTGLIALSRSDGEIDAYVRHWLGPLLDFDAEHRSNLVAALRAYLDNWGDCPRTARALGIDTTTVLNRLHHVRQLLAVDLTDGDTRFHLQVATRLLR